MKKYDVIIIGAGTSGLTARREIAKKTQNYLVIDDGPLGTTCARVGCMPSKVLIQAANDFHRRHKFESLGISGADKLEVSTEAVMKHVRSLRDRFVRGVKVGMEDWENTHLLRGRAKFIDSHTVEVDGEQLSAEKFVLAPGSRPLIPGSMMDFKSHILTSDDIFELKSLPKSIAVVGLGVIGIELGQALNRLGVNVSGITLDKAVGGLTDPDVQDYAAMQFETEFPIYYGPAQLKEITKDDKIKIQVDEKEIEVDKVILSMGRRSNVDRLDLQKTSAELTEKGLPKYNNNTMVVDGANHIFVPGDVNGDRPILHEASDEGTIAGHNVFAESPVCFKRRTNLGITFTDPNIATVGKRHADIKEDFVTGEVSFEGQGRSIVKLKEIGLLHVYVSKKTQEIIGAEMMAPDGEHLAHLLAWGMSLKLTVFEMLKMPFYHPVIEEGLRTALRNAAAKLPKGKNQELYRCADTPIR
jgi:dihydrolipoamide dehydrogenase